MVCHVGLFATFITMQMYRPPRKPSSSVINVSMVSMPASKPSKPAAAPAKVKKAAPKPPVKAKKPEVSVKKQASRKPEVSTATQKWKRKTSLKQKTYKTEKIVKSAISKIEKKVEDEPPPPLTDALERLKSKVQQEEANRSAAKQPPVQAPRVGTGTGQGSGKQILELINIYRVEVAFQIERNWAFSDQLAGEIRDLEAKIVFKVYPDGQIRDIFFTDRSGNTYLDESAYKAVVKSNPVIPHPQGLIKPYVQMGLRFTPQGVK